MMRVWRLSVCRIGPKSRTERARTRKTTRHRGSPRHMWLGHHFQGQKVKGQRAGSGAYCGGLPHSYLLWVDPGGSLSSGWLDVISILCRPPISHPQRCHAMSVRYGSVPMASHCATLASIHNVTQHGWRRRCQQWRTAPPIWRRLFARRPAASSKHSPSCKGHYWGGGNMRA